MKCPHCPTTTLVMSDRQGIEIDYCPDCRGVWLDRGELDKLIERANNETSRPSTDAIRRDRRDDSDEIERLHYSKHPKKKKMSSLLGDIFDL